MVQLWRDPTSRQYGLKQFRLPDGSYSYVVPLTDVAKPDIIDEHGTKVTLFGFDDDDNTVTAPEGVPTPSRWFARYLNARFFNFPKGVIVRARQGWTYDPEDTNHNILQRVRGMGDFLDEHADHSGVVDLTGCQVHWWILDDSDKRRKTSELTNNGHFGALYQGELYEMATGRSGTARLQQFGVLLARNALSCTSSPRTARSAPCRRTPHARSCCSAPHLCHTASGRTSSARASRRRSVTTWTQSLQALRAWTTASRSWSV